MRIVLDTNVVLDVLLDRLPFASEAAVIWEAHDDGLIQAAMTASSLTDVYYIISGIDGPDEALAKTRMCLDVFEFCPVDAEILKAAAAMPGKDFEDNVQIACAVRGTFDAIVTRDKNGFSSSPIPVLSPAEMVTKLQAR